MEVSIVTLEDDLHKIVADINNASWDKENEISGYTEKSLRLYLQRQDTIFLVCYQSTMQGSALLGMASSRIEIKPYREKLWLYIDEVDVCSNFRRKGAGRLLMQKLMEIAKERACDEIWLGAEVDNDPANALYQSLAPDQVLDFISYTYKNDKE